MTDLPEMRPIAGYEGLYSITRDGRVFAHARQTYYRDGRPAMFYPDRWLSTQKLSTGYLDIKLRAPCVEQKHHLVHILVAKAYVPNPLNLPEVNHKDNNPANPNDWNLEWTSTQGNKGHSMSSGKSRNKTGFYGVSKKKYNFEVRACVDGNRKYVGSHPTPEGAAKLYDAFVRQHNLDLPLNFPD